MGWRITGVGQKALYIVVGYAASALFYFVLRTWLLDPHSWPYGLIALIGNLAYNIVGVRIFRGYLEPVRPPRPWWRWTGRPKAGFWLGALNLFAVLGTLPEFWPRDGQGPHYVLATLNLLGLAIPAFGYFNSSLRLRLHPDLWSQRRPKAPAKTRELASPKA